MSREGSPVPSKSVTATSLLARCARHRRDYKTASCVPGARTEQTGGRFYRMTSDQVLDCALEFASQRRGHGSEYEGQQETKAFGECAQEGWGWDAGDWDPTGVVAPDFGGTCNLLLGDG